MGLKLHVLPNVKALPSEGQAWGQAPWDGWRESSWCWCTSSLTASRPLLSASSPPAGSTGALVWD